MAGGYRGSVVGSLGNLFESGTFAGLGEAQLLDRFLSRRDEAAFEAILQRHGPMVLGVCRRVLDDPHDVADAFQATFLILVRKARSIRDRDALGTWLYGVARRVAVRARVDARRRGAREVTGIIAEAIDVESGSERSRSDRLERQELAAIIDDELERLPARYRAPVILCDLEGRTHEQAAAQLGCPVGTVKSRLARGRDRLRSGLIRRGVAPTAGLLSATLAAESAHAVPIDLLSTTLGAATRLAAGQAIAVGASSAGAASLTKGVLRSMLLAKFSISAAALIAAALATTGLRGLIVPATPEQGPRQAASPPSPRPAPPAPEPFRTPVERGVERFQLANGLKVFLRPIKGSKETALVVVYSIGNDHDPEGRSGLAHAIEHLYITAAGGETEARTTDELMKRYPGGANGQTGDRYTVISTTFPADRLDAELTDAAARMKDLRVTADDLDRERPRLVQELANMYERHAVLAAMNNAREQVRPSPGDGRRGGTPEFVRSLKLDEVRDRLDRHYKPHNAILALAGDFDAAAARKAIEAQFAALPAGEAIPPPREPAAPKNAVVVVPRGTRRDPQIDDEPTACLAYRAPGPDSAHYAPLLVLVARLWAEGGRLSSDGITGSPIYFTPIDDGAVVAITETIRPGEAPAKAFERIEQYVARMAACKLDADEVANVKAQFGMLLGLENNPVPLLQGKIGKILGLENLSDSLLGRNPYGVAFSIARREQLGLDPAKLGRALDSLNDQDIRRAAAAIFAPARRAGAVAGLDGPRS